MKRCVSYTGYTWSGTKPKPLAVRRFNAGFSQREPAKKANEAERFRAYFLIRAADSYCA